MLCDMEGVSGIVNWSQVNGGAPLYEEGRRLYTAEVNAAVRGAFGGGATEVVVVDCHGAGGGWNFNSLLPEELDPRCDWVAHHTWTGYTELLEQGCDGALFIGMHARAGTEDGVLSHTVSSEAWHNLWFNDVLVGETGINAAFCGTWNCPVLLVTGDAATCAEARELLGPELTTVAVKRGLSRYSARQIPPARARDMIEVGAREAVQATGRGKPYQPGEPCVIVVEVSTPDRADRFRYKHGIMLRDSRFVVSRGESWWPAWRQLWW